MDRRWTLLGIVALGCACAPRSSEYDYTLPHPGPAMMAKTVGGYELKNRWAGLRIDPTTGDITYWGAADGDQNLLGPAGLRARLEGAMEVAPSGSVEKRDEQTWQYIGEDANQIRWRKIYNLDGESVYATFLVENLESQPRDLTVVLAADLRGSEILGDDLRIDAATEVAPVFLQGYREDRSPGNWEKDRPRLRSDATTLKPGERISFTTEWKIDHPRY